MIGNAISQVIDIMGGMIVEWIKREIAVRGLQKQEVAAAAGLTSSQFSAVLHGNRRLMASELDAIRRYFGFKLPEDEVRFPVRIAWAIGPDARVIPLDTPYMVIRPLWIPGDEAVTGAVITASAGMTGLPGDLLFWRSNKQGVAQRCLGRAVVALPDDGASPVAGRLEAGDRPGRWTVSPFDRSVAPIYNARLKWASRIFAPQFREDVRVVQA